MTDLCVLAEGGREPVYAETEGDAVAAALRGGADPADILNLGFAARTDGVAFAGGTGYGPLVERYRETVSGKLKGLSAGKRLWLAGHGLGGAFALLAAVEMLAQGVEVAAVYTYGAPRVGDAQLVKRLTCPVFRVVNNLDVMATIPPPWKWRHAGQQILIDADGRLNLNPNALNRLPSLLRQTAWLGEMLAQGLTSGYPRALNTLLKQVLGDHALEAYRLRLQALEEGEPAGVK
jgi:pimeloyl-ACP methyl ester carboxylesterase